MNSDYQYITDSDRQSKGQDKIGGIEKRAKHYHNHDTATEEQRGMSQQTARVILSISTVIWIIPTCLACLAAPSLLVSPLYSVTTKQFINPTGWYFAILILVILLIVPISAITAWWLYQRQRYRSAVSVSLVPLIGLALYILFMPTQW
jgi:hypothetical protein